MKGDKPPCRTKDCQHNVRKHAEGGGCTLCPCKEYKS